MKKLVITKLLKNKFVQFVLGFAFSIYIPALLMWGGKWNILDTRQNSVFLMALFYILSFYTLHYFFSHINTLTFRYIIPVFSFWSVLISSFILVFRIDYSIWYLAIASIIILSLLILFDYTDRFNQHKVVGYIKTERVQELPEVSYITWKKLEAVTDLDKNSVDMVTADLRADLSDQWQQFLASCTLKHIPVYHSSRLLERVTGRVRIDHLYENELGELLPSKSYQIIKRLCDIWIILASLPLTFPLMIVISLLVMVDCRGKIFFLQERIGQGGVPFIMYKFCSMNRNAEKDGCQFAQVNDERVTRIGKFIRKTRLDELPQFYNVLRGEMSLIGPRPEQKVFVDDFNKEIPFYNYRHIVKPGISGWAQVMHGYTSDTDNTRIKLEYDFYYIKNFSFSIDLLILFKTIQTILTGFGAR